MPTITDQRLERVADQWLRLPNARGIPVEVCAGPGVPVEPAAIDELLALLELSDSLERLAEAAPARFEHTGPPRIERVVLTPDVHKGAGIPIGTVMATSGVLLPKAVGNDINCGMRLEVTALTVEQVRPHLDRLERELRHLFFHGGRRLALTPGQREALLRDGLPGLLGEPGAPDPEGVWRRVGQGEAGRLAGRAHGGGRWPARSAHAYADWVGSAGGASYDAMIGSVGGGNHFAELQYVAAVRDSRAAWAWGLRPGRVVTMVHSGSLGLGHQANLRAAELARRLWPAGLAHPAGGLFPLPLDEASAPAREAWLDEFAGAANFAAGNRFVLSLMLREGLARTPAGDPGAELVWDAPHNLLWPLAGHRVLHRKGATPAGGWVDLADGPYQAWGEPVIVPGSMGAASWVLRGLGNERTLGSACHGAGRSVARGAATRGGDAELDAFLREFRVVTPLDHRDPRLRGRADVLAAWRRDLKQEAPWAYKDVAPVVATLAAAGVAEPVAELRPLLTVKA